MKYMIAASRGRNPDNPSERGRSNGRYRQMLEFNRGGVSNTLTGVQKDNMVVQIYEIENYGHTKETEASSQVVRVR